MKISIVTATYNSAKTLEQTILSVLNQTHNNIEYIIIDGGSTDGTIDIIKKYNSKIAYWISEPDQGIYDALNKGISVATGEYIQFLGSDDTLCERNTIKNVVDNLSSKIDILSTFVMMVDEDYKIQKEYSNYVARNKETYDGSMIPHPGMFVRTSIMKKRFFDTKLKIVSDYDFFLNCYYKCPSVEFKYIDLRTVFFSLGGVSAVDRKKIEIENKLMFHRYDLKKKLKEIEKNTSKRYILKHDIKRIIEHLLKKIKLYKRYLMFFYDWEDHHCENKICRWCDRK